MLSQLMLVVIYIFTQKSFAILEKLRKIGLIFKNI